MISFFACHFLGDTPMQTHNAQRSFFQRSLVLGTIAAAVLVSACSTSVETASSADARTGANGSIQSGSTQSGGAAANNLDGNALNNAQANLIKVVYFDFDSAVVRPEFNAGIDAQAQFLNADRSRRVKLEGHTDERGGSEYNLALGQQRAEAIRRSLTVLGVNASQIEAVSYGKEKLAMPGADEASHAKNRRVEFVR
jgi:peptidoglycan-associated lipoprotein